LQSANAFNFSEIEKKSLKPEQRIENIKEKITKELFFEVMKSRFMDSVDLEQGNVGQLLKSEMQYGSSLAFDENGNPVTKWQKEYPAGYLVIPNSFAFDMILANSYGLKYKPSDSYKKSDENYKISYYVCVSRFDRVVLDLLRYYVGGETEALERTKETLVKWKDPQTRPKYGSNYADCFMPSYQFADDYNEFIKAQLAYADGLKKAQQEKLAVEREKNSQAEAARSSRIKKEKKLADAKHQETIVALAQKWKNIGIPADILVSQMRTYAGMAASGDLGTLVEFIDMLPGTKQIEAKGAMVVLHQQTKDEMTNKTHTVKWGFQDLRKKQGCVWLERVILDGQEYPTAQLFYLVAQVLQK
jgi:hypothetical protein